MKILKYNILFALLVCMSTSLMANSWPLSKEVSRTISETFDVADNPLLTVENKYGSIDISTWEKDQVQVDVMLTVKSGNEEKAQKFLDDIEIEFNNSNRGVSAKTLYPNQGNSSWWSSWWGSSSNIQYEVNYTIKAPESMSVDLLNKYGNIALSSIEGEAKITNKYGDISAQDIDQDLDLDLGYGKASFADIKGNANVLIKYSKFFIDGCKDMDIESKYSTIKIGTCNQLVSLTKYDDYKINKVESIKNVGKYDEFIIGEIGVFNLQSKYTDVEIVKLNESGVFETKYGKIIINDCASTLKEIDLNSKYTDMYIDIVSGFSIDFDGHYSNLDINLDYDKSHYIKDGNQLEVKGKYKSGGAMIKATMKYGKLKIE